MTWPGLRYGRPGTLADATELLATLPGSVPLAGGQSLLAQLALRRAHPSLLVDLAGLEGELGGIHASGETLRIGALARQQDLLADPIVLERAPVLAAAARLVANQQVRSRGTVGGALANGDPPAEIPAALAALGAAAQVSGPNGEREIALAGADGSPASLDLAAGELVTSVIVPAERPPRGWDVDEVAGRFAARPLVTVAAVADGARGGGRVAVAGVTASPVVIERQARDLGDAEAGSLAASIHARLLELAPVADTRASVDYRLQVAATLAARSLRRAARGSPPGRRAPAPAGRSGPSPPQPALPPSSTAEVVVTVNGRRHALAVDGGRTLAHLLRDDLELTGTHLGCEHGVCGACNVLVDGTAVRSCLMLAAQADGREVSTVEGLRDRGALERLLPAFVERRALQCGYCTPGMLVTLAGLAEPPGDRRGLREQLVGNLCRCTGYRPILDAAEDAL
jgi:CO/xanthine dehydrogenase FAD-binding subunit/aerobic-type carbon monoxide dehydrogenase small subunit (CoxS/CutS family)